jgi:hypothetical protein
MRTSVFGYHEEILGFSFLENINAKIILYSQCRQIIYLLLLIMLLFFNRDTIDAKSVLENKINLEKLS